MNQLLTMKKIVFITLFLCVALIGRTQIYKTVECTAGNLSSLLTSEEKSNLTNLTLIGTINATDFRTMFYNMPKLAVIDLTEATISECSIKIGYKTINYPANTIPTKAFYDDAMRKGKLTLISISLPQNIISIGASAFMGCSNLNSIQIPHSVSMIGSETFKFCVGLNDIILPESLLSIESNVFSGSGISEFIIPSSVKTIKQYGFAGCIHLKDIVIPNTVLRIERVAFYSCKSLTSITLSTSLTKIEEHTFSGCSALKSITIPPSVETIEGWAFESCSNLVAINIPETVKSIGYGAFLNCKGLTKISLPTSLKAIDGCLFSYCENLNDLTIPSSITTIGSFAFYGCTKLSSLNIPANVSSIGSDAFSNCTSLKSIFLPEALTSIESSLFMGCVNLNSISIPSRISKIGDFTFSGCSKLTSITLPETLALIGQSTFSNCVSIDTISAMASKPLDINYYYSVFDDLNKDNCKIFVPFGSKGAYQTAPVWKSFKNFIETEGFLVSIDSLILEANEGSKTSIPIAANMPWSVSSDQPWLTVNKMTGSGNDTLLLVAKINASSTIRMAKVTFSAPGQKSKTVIVNQEAGNVVSLLVSKESVWFDAMADSNAIIEIACPSTWNAKSDQTWLTVSPTTGSNNGAIILTATVNTGDSRTATVTVSSTGLASKTIIVTQAAQATLQVSSNTLTIFKDANSTASVTVTSNIDWTVSSDQSWLKVSPSSGKGNKSIVFIAEANSSLNPRTATVIIAATGTASQLITVTQAAELPNLAVAQNKIRIAQAENSNASVTITSNTQWTASCEQTWLTINQASGIGNQTLSFSASANLGSGSRTAVVTVSATGTKAQIISVIQSAQPGMPDLVVKTTNVSPVVDGLIDVNDPWTNDWIPMSTPCWRNETSAMSSKFQILAGENAFYIAIIVEDNTLSNYSDMYINTYERDCSEIFISMDTVASNVKVLETAGNWHIRTHRNNDLFESNWQNILTADPKFAAISKTSATEYVQELILPFSALTNGITKAWDGKYFRFDAATSDNTSGFPGGRTQQQFWNSGSDEQWRDTKYYGKAKIEANGPSLDLNKTTIEMTADDSVASFAVESSVSWAIKSDQNWLTVSPSMGSNNKTIDIFATKNTGEIRTATLTISALGLPNKTITITQAAGDVTLTVSQQALIMGQQENSSANVEITSNSSWTVSSNQAWLTVSPASGTGNGTLTFTAEANTGLSSRTATVTVAATGATSQTITITQAAGDVTLTVSQQALIMGQQENSSANVEITSNRSWTANSNQAWLTVSPASGTGNGTLTFTAEANTGLSSRTATVTVAATGATSRTIIITQDAIGALPTIAASDYFPTIAQAANSTINLEIASNTSWTVSSANEWLTVNQSTGTGNKLITFTASANLSPSSRTAFVTISATGARSLLIRVTQATLNPILTVSQNIFYVSEETNSSVSVFITSNSLCTATSDQDWLTVNPKTWTGNNTIVLSVLANNLSNPRIGTVTVSAPGAVSQIITVTQAAQVDMPVIMVKSSQPIPAVDGVIDDKDPWTTEWIPMSASYLGNTTSNMSAKFQILSGIDALYVAIIVEDATPNNNKDLIKYIYERDCSELFFSMDTNTVATDGVYKNGCWHLNIQREAEYLVTDVKGSGLLLSDPKFAIASASSTTGYIQELILPYSPLIAGMDPVWDGKTFRIDITCFDNTTGFNGGRTQQQFWNSKSDLQYKDTRYFGLAEIEQNIPSLKLDQTTVSLTSGASETIVNVVANVEWTATSDQPWLTVSPTSGTGDGNITLFANENTTNAKRIATVTINGEGVSSKTINVTQLAAEAIFEVSPLSVQVGKEQGSTGNANIVSNVPWKATSNADWLSVSPTSGTGNGTLVFTAEANNSITSRSTTVVVESDGFSSKTISITQAAGSETLTVSENSLNLNYKSNSKATFNITSNTSWTIANDQSWLTVSPTSGTGNGTITLNVQENPLSTSRVANLTVFANGVIDKTIEIVQIAAPVSLLVNPLTLEISTESSEAVYSTIFSNNSWIVAGGAEWLNISPKSGTGDGELKFTAQANLSAVPRSATVKVTSRDLPPQTITITQAAAKAYLTISKSIEEMPSFGGEVLIEIKSNSNWEVEADQPWLSVSPSKGSGNGNLSLSVSANKLLEQRTANVTISSAGLPMQKVTIIQEGEPESLLINDSIIAYTALGGETIINIFSNDIWLANSDQWWLSVSPDIPFNGNGNLVITSQPNIDNKERKAKVSIFTNNLSHTIDVVQEASQGIDGINKIDQSSILLYPTLVDESFYIVGIEEIAELEICDSNGRVVLSKKIVNNQRISVNALKKGVYFVGITNSKETTRRKIIKK